MTRRIRDVFTSLELTLTCLAALMLLVVACTLSQVHLGTWEAVAVTMRSWFVWWEIPRTGLPVPVFPGGVLVGLALGVNLVAAQVSRLERSWRKTGIWIIHAGLILLVLGEFVSGAFQVDARMALEEGQTLGFVESPREQELAVVDVTDPGRPREHAIRESRLSRAGPTEVPGTPLTLAVKGYLRNAALGVRRPEDPPPSATAGVGVDVTVRELPPVSADGEINRAAAFVELFAGGESHGTWLVSNALRAPQSFAHAGRSYLIGIRPRRQYLPYTLTLKDFRHDVYPGTDIPKSFSSLVHLSNRSTGEEREVLISMNQPLRYGGRAFYQSSFGKNDTLSILQVVENPGWRLPYVSAGLVALGLLVHFGASLRRATRRRRAPGTPTAAPAALDAAAGKPRTRSAQIAPSIAAVLALAGALSAAVPPGRSHAGDLDAFARVAVLEGGRVKPIGSVARNALLVLHGRQSLRHDGRTIGADAWLLDVMFRPEVADARPTFVIDDPEVLGLMGLQQTSVRHFSFAMLRPWLEDIQREGEAAHRIDPRQRSRFQSAIANLLDRIVLYHRLRNTMQPAGSRGLGAEIEAASIPRAAERHAALAELAYFRPLPPAPGRPPEAWRSAGEALRAAAAGERDAALERWARVSRAWRSQDASTFDRAIGDLRDAAATPRLARRAELEALFNRAQPFHAAMVIDVVALLVLFASWLWMPAVLRPTAFGLTAAGALVHTAGLAFRIVLQGRPPVTNLYSSAVFVGWAAVLLGLALERMYRRGFGTAVAASSGFASLVVAHHLAAGGDTLEMMRAVLDSNFWLATHVVTITIGYSGTFVAGALALAEVIRRHVARLPDPGSARTTAGMVYGVVCFALFFSFVGTVLGGIWADQSWGRFWGWDPKENGALLIVLWNALVLHARWAGFVRERGIMAMAIVGNVVTSLSWFGVNMLGVGLHSYGFMDQATWALSAFIASQLACAALALAPPRFWQVRAPEHETREAGAVRD